MDTIIREIEFLMCTVYTAVSNCFFRINILCFYWMRFPFCLELGTTLKWRGVLKFNLNKKLKAWHFPWLNLNVFKYPSLLSVQFNPHFPLCFQEVTRSKPVLLVISLSGIKVCSSNGEVSVLFITLISNLKAASRKALGKWRRQKHSVRTGTWEPQRKSTISNRLISA